MGIFNNEIIVDYDNPFKNDILQRENEAKTLTELFDAIGNQMVLAINSPWGTGKSSFLKMWNQYLINEGYKTIFFNSWENDFIDEPFIAFINEIRECLDLNENDNIIKSAKHIWESIITQSPRVICKVIKNKTGIDAEDIVSTDYLSDLIGEKINSYKADKDSISNFRDELKQIAQNNYDVSKKPLVIFVDELDRCRPDYAIKLLERIKHIFNVDKIIFVLGIDKEALSNSVKIVYGEQTDTKGYLSRFIDLEFKLETSSRILYIRHLFNKYLGSQGNLGNKFKNCIEVLLEIFNLSYREMEKFIVELYIMVKLKKINNDDIYFTGILSIIKRMNNNLYNRIKNKDIMYEELEIELRKHLTSTDKLNKKNGKWDYVKAYLLVILDDKYEFSKISNSIEENDKRCCKIYNRILNEYLLSDAKEFEEILIGIYNDIEMHKYSFEFS